MIAEVQFAKYLANLASRLCSGAREISRRVGQPVAWAASDPFSTLDEDATNAILWIVNDPTQCNWSWGVVSEWKGQKRDGRSNTVDV